MTGRNQAYTLLELLLVMGMIMLMLAGGILQTRQTGGGGQSSKALALTVSSQLRTVHAQAMATGSPMALVFPSANATTPFTQGDYILQGNGTLFATAFSNFASECPGAYIFNGDWTPSSGSFIVEPPPPGNPFNVSGWLNPMSRDYVFAFSPSGTVSTNDLPFNSASGQWNLVVCSGVSYIPTGPPTGNLTMGGNSTNYYQLTAVDQPWTIGITPHGAISAQPGLTSASNAVGIGTAPSVPPVAPASVPTASQLNAPPVISGVYVAPLGNPINSLNFTTTVPPTGYAQLQVIATDPCGCALSYSWTATAGNFSLSFPQTLQYDSAIGAYQSTVNWFPPPGTSSGASFSLTCTVTDPNGTSASATGNSTVTVGVLQLGHIVFGGSDGHVYIMNGDGTAPVPLSPQNGFVDCQPVLAQNGGSIAFSSNRIANHVSKPSIWDMNTSGSGGFNVTGTTSNATTQYQNDSLPSWSPDGSSLAFVRYTPTAVENISGNWTLVNVDTYLAEVVSANGNPTGVDLDNATAIAWGGTQPPGWLAYANNGSIWQMNPDGSGKIQMTNGTNDTSPSWSPDASRILFVRLDSANSTTDIYEALANTPYATQNITLKWPGWGGSTLSFRPNGQQFIGIQGNNLYQFSDPGLGQTVSTAPQVLTPPSLPWGVHPTGTCSWGP